MYEEILKLKERYCNATNDTEGEAIDREMKALAEQDGQAFGEAMLKAAQDTVQRADILVDLSRKTRHN